MAKINPFSAYAITSCTVVPGSTSEGRVLLKRDDQAGSRAQPVEAVVPQWLTGPDSGIFASGSLLMGTKVYACRSTSDDYIIIGKKELNYHSATNSEMPTDTPAGSAALPSAIIADGETCMVGSHGSMILLSRSGMSLTTPIGAGLSIGMIDNDATRSFGIQIYHGYANINAGGWERSGPVYRALEGRLMPDEDDDNDFNASRTLRGTSRGVFPGSTGEEIPHGETPRNIPLSEYRHVINEFPPYTRFCGFSGEAHKVFDDAANVVSSEHKSKYIRGINDKNSLFLDCNQLIEVLGGNIVDVFGNVLDINYMPIVFGGSGGRVPDQPLKFEEARLLSRRGLGYHFQLDTNTESGDDSNSLGNFTLGIDKEGVVKVNIPKGSSTGNIPFVSSADFYNEGNSTGVTSANESSKEDVPITLRNESGDVLLPPNYKEEAGYTRATGIRYANSWEYFPESTTGIGSEGGTVRVNSTRYHNMYAAAEMLIANTIIRLNIPPSNMSKLAGISSGQASGGHCFEKLTANICNSGRDLNAPQSDAIARAIIMPALPVMDTGGGTIVCGQSFQLDVTQADGFINSPLGNNFVLAEQTSVGDAARFSKKITEPASPLSPAGGKSMHMNLEGSIEASVGQDERDNKSIVLDTAGSLIAWLGADNKGRSMVVQTDGDVAVNVGGQSGDSFNPGRFDLRVNVTNKGNLRAHAASWNGTTPTTGDAESGGGSSDRPNMATFGPQASDYIISIGPHGLTIAGMNTGAPMIIRNDGDLMIEATQKLILAGTSVKIREGGLAPRSTHKDVVSKDDGEMADPLKIPDVFAEAIIVVDEKLFGRSCVGDSDEAE